MCENKIIIIIIIIILFVKNLYYYKFHTSTRGDAKF